jgi:hypothetical protein
MECRLARTECANSHVGCHQSGAYCAGPLAVARSFSMPFPLIPTALGLCFLLMWVFIGGMIFRDGQIAARRDSESDGHILPLTPSPLAARGSTSAGRSKIARRNAAARIAS